MGMFTECPWCHKEFHSNAYPRSAGMRKVLGKEKRHMKEEHEELYEEYNKILEVWYEKVVNGEGGIDSFLKFIKNLTIRRNGASRPNPEIVLEYDYDDIKRMNEEEIREVVERYN